MTVSTIGNTLKEARAKKDLTLEDVQAKLKIHPRVLQLLEEDRFEKLPSPLFVRSFLRSYADFLEVNSDELLQAYEREGRREPEQVIFLRPAEERLRAERSREFPWAAVAGVAAAVAFTGLVFGGAALLKRIEWPKAPPKPARVERKAVPKAAPAPAPASAAKREWLRSVEQGNFPKIAKRTPLELTVKAVDNVWLRVTADGQVVFQQTMRRGASNVWSAKTGLEIWTGNSSNMALSLNGYPLGSPGKGVVKKMVINHEGVKIPS